MIKPTKEQEDIVKATLTASKLKVNACSGSGKTSTLSFIAQANIKPSLYIAFNKAIADEASEKFPSHVECRTTHSLAFAKFGRDLMHKLSRPRGGYRNVAGTVLEIAKYYKISEIQTQEGVIKENVVAGVVKGTVRRYEQSSDKEITASNIPYTALRGIIDKHPSVDRESLKNTVLRHSRKLWEDRTDVHSDVLATHDTYLKLYQLSKPRLDYDIIYLDEAQDTGDTVLDIVLNQEHAKVVYVGDTYQSIYEWRGAINAMEKVNCQTLMLTQSFRYGQDIADLASKIINYEIDIKGNPKTDSKVEYAEEELTYPYTKLYRTNSVLLFDAVGYLNQGVDVSCEVNTNDLKKLLESAVALFKGDMKNVKHEEVVPYSDWQEYVEAGKEEPEINRVVKFVTQGLANKLIMCLSQLKKKDNADITLTTAHKSKGLEWDTVVLADDFPNLSESGELPDQERNLLYVAATRAMKTLVVNTTCREIMEVR